MTDLADLALAAISQAQRRVEIAAENLANVTTPAYKRRVPFAVLVAQDDEQKPTPTVKAAIDFTGGKLSQTGNPADLAISGPGYFVVRQEDRVLYSRNGQFAVDGEGRLVNPQGFVLQLANGADLKVSAAAFEVRSDGTVVDKGVVLGRIALFAPDDEHAMEPATGGFTGPASQLPEQDRALIRQGAIETSNVSTGDEMVVMMEALRRAEAGQRVMNVYDDLMGRVITSFGESGR